MNNKRLLFVSLLLSILMAASLTGHAKIPIELWFPPGNQVAENMQPIVDRFNATHPDIEAVMLVRDPTPEAVLTAVAGDVMPNVIFGAHSWSPTYAAQGLLVDLWHYIIRDGLEEEYTNDFFPGALYTGNTYKGQLIGLPLLLQIESLYYNPHLFDQFGVAVPDEGWTWDDYASLAQTMTRRDADGNVTTFGAGGTNAQNMAILSLMRSGATIWDEDTYQSTVQTASFREGSEFLQDLVQREVVHLGQGVPFAGNIMRDHFLNGNVAIHLDGTYRLQAIEDQAPDIRVLPLPRKDAATTPVTMLTLRNLNILQSRDADVQEASWTFVKWLMTPDNLAEASVGISALAGRASVIQHPVYFEYISRSPHLSAFSSLLTPYATGIGFTGIPGRDEIFSQGFTPLTVQMLKGELPVPSYLDQLDQAVNQILEGYR